MEILKNRKFLIQLLWLMVFIVPWGIGGFAIHRAAALSIGMLLYWGTGLLVPVFFFLFQRKGYGEEWGAYRAAVHVPLWLSVICIEMTAFWNYLPTADQAFKDHPIPVAVLLFAVMAVFVAVTIGLDYLLLPLYQKLKEKGGLWASWLGSVFFCGVLPGTAITAFMGLYTVGGMRLDPFTAGFFLMEIFSFVFYGKVLLAMMTFGTFLFFSLEGTKGRRMTQVVFTAIFWIMLVYIPFVISLHLPGTGTWRAYMDPSYLSVFPILSDLWMCGLAILAGEKITAWIFK